MSKLQGCWRGAGDGNAQQLRPRAWQYRACEVGLTGPPYRLNDTATMIHRGLIRESTHLNSFLSTLPQPIGSWTGQL